MDTLLFPTFFYFLMNTQVTHPREINSMFDTISYAKGVRLCSSNDLFLLSVPIKLFIYIYSQILHYI